jgi:hypothetical protein
MTLNTHTHTHTHTHKQATLSAFTHLVPKLRMRGTILRVALHASFLSRRGDNLYLKITVNFEHKKVYSCSISSASCFGVTGYF